MREPYGEAWVCQDCYFAHHYGAHQEEYAVGDDEALALGLDARTVMLWFAGEDDEPVGGWHEIRHNHSLEHNREPLGHIGDGFEVFDWTCSNHTWDREMECPVCDDGAVAIFGSVFADDFAVAICWVCDGSGQIVEPCPECGSDSDEDGIQDFSWSACDGCHSPLGGSRYRLSLWKREEVTA